MTPIATLRIFALPDDVLTLVRGGGPDASGHRPVPRSAEGDEPVRCCLRDAQPGERLLLFGFEPPLPPSPYREVGAVYAHADDCDRSRVTTTYPIDWLGRPQVLRAYDRHGWIHPATRRHDGTDPMAALDAVLSESGVVQVHSRNVSYGCWMFTATR